jgi:transcriptional regulator with XRE-family HTH domain
MAKIGKLTDVVNKRTDESDCPDDMSCKECGRCDTITGMEILVRRMQMLMTKNNLSVAKVEKELEFPNGTIRRFLLNVPSAYKVMQIARFFNVSTDYLLGFSNHQKNFNGEVLKYWNLLNDDKQSYIIGMMHGLAEYEPEPDDKKLPQIERQKEYLRKEIESMTRELAILESKSKHQVNKARRGF